MKAREADTLGTQIAAHLHSAELEAAYALVAPVLERRIRFEQLGRIGKAVGSTPDANLFPFLDRLAAEGREGGWPIIGAALCQRLATDFAGSLERCRSYIVVGDVWFAADILAERVPGPALVDRFATACRLLEPWRSDPNRWVRRAVGVAVHYWVKRAHGREELRDQAETLLALLDPMFEEWEMDAAKGVGWGLKTLGRHFPELLTAWLEDQVALRGRRHRAVMLRKAVTYLSEEQRTRITGNRLGSDSAANG